MNEVTIRVRDVRESSEAFRALAARFDIVGFKTVRDASALVERSAKKNFQSRKGGRNDPATPPRPTLRTGNLRNSIHSSPPERRGGSTWSAKVGPTLMYGRRVELGFDGMVSGYVTKRGTVVQSYHATTRKFPYLAPAFKDNEDNIFEIWKSHVREAVKG